MNKMRAAGKLAAGLTSRKLGNFRNYEDDGTGEGFRKEASTSTKSRVLILLLCPLFGTGPARLVQVLCDGSSTCDKKLVVGSWIGSLGCTRILGPGPARVPVSRASLL